MTRNISAVPVCCASDSRSSLSSRVFSVRNSSGGMTGPQIVVFDGEKARLLVSDDGPENPISLDRIVLGITWGDGLKMHDKFCK